MMVLWYKTDFTKGEMVLGRVRGSNNVSNIPQESEGIFVVIAYSGLVRGKVLHRYLDQQKGKLWKIIICDRNILIQIWNYGYCGTDTVDTILRNGYCGYDTADGYCGFYRPEWRKQNILKTQAGNRNDDC